MTRRSRRQAMAPGQAPPHVDLHIDRLTLEGVTRIEGQRIVDSLKQALVREIEGHAMPEVSRHTGHEGADLATGRRLLPEETGAALARIVVRQAFL